MSRLTVVWIALVLGCTSNEGNAPGGAKPVCGDGVCFVSEIHTCPADCGMPGTGTTAVCGNGVCETGENTTSCPADCAVSMCGDGVCEAGESSSNCPQDCPTTETFDCASSATQDDCLECFQDDFELGVGTCDEFGDAFPGSADDCAMCVANGSFGNTCESACGNGETDACALCETDCGDGFCEVQDGENQMNCPMDCPVVPCGDGICDVEHGETAMTCSADCLLADSFDCSDQNNQDDCENCFFDDSTAEGGILGQCDTDHEVFNGSSADCAKCASIGAWGSDCEPFCSAGESNACATCVAQAL